MCFCRGLDKRHADQEKRQEIKCTGLLKQEHFVSVRSYHFSISSACPLSCSLQSSIHQPRTSSLRSETLMQSLCLSFSLSIIPPLSLPFPPLYLSLSLFSMFPFLPIILLGNSCTEVAQMKMFTEATVLYLKRSKGLETMLADLVWVCSQRTLITSAVVVMAASWGSDKHLSLRF